MIRSPQCIVCCVCFLHVYAVAGGLLASAPAHQRLRAQVGQEVAWRPGWAPQHTSTPYSHLYVSCFVYGNCSCLLLQVHGEVVAWVGPPCPSALVSQQRGAFMQHHLPGEGHAAA